MIVEGMRGSFALPTAAVIALGGCAAAQTGGVDGAGGMLGGANAVAGAPTFYADALPIFQKNCVACHQPDGPDVGGIRAPMSLMSYQAAHEWAPMIREALETGYMPPWGAQEQHKGTFKDERYIEPDEKQTLIAWVDAGALAGDPADAPSSEGVAEGGEASLGGTTLPPSGWWIGDTDLIVQFAEPVHVAEEVRDWQPTVQMPVPEGQLTEAQWVSKAELRPGGPWVHHIVSSHMGVGVPGRGPFAFPEGWGVLLPEDPFITLNMHYHKTPGPGTAVDDLTRAGFVFYEPGDVIDYVVETNLLLHRDWVIPAGHGNYEVSNTHSIEEDIYLLSMGPHMHYRGKAMRYELEYSDGEMETLLWVPDYDFNWQFQYEYEEPKFIPAGSTIHMTWWFDNSLDNPWNPDPTAEVEYGAATTDEMANARIYYASATPQGIVVGEEIPQELLQRAREAEERRRERTTVDFGQPPTDDLDWLNDGPADDGQAR